MADCLISSVKEIGKCIWDSFLKGHVDYWWCFDDNIQQLRDGIRKLEWQTLDIQQKIEVAQNNAEIVRPGVQEWLKSGNDKLVEAKTTFPNDNTPEAWKLISRYSLGKKAKETAEEIAKLLNDGDFNLIADPAPPPARRFTALRSTMDFESRKHIEEEIIDSLKQSSVGMIGICGMGGVGKTTMAERIGVRVKEGKQFEEVVMVTVGQKIDMGEIQNEIAEKLSLNLDANSMDARAYKLRMRLMDDTKRKLVIFDDVWDNLEYNDCDNFQLEKLGVPFNERCKILLTTRSKEVCQKMEAQKIIVMKILTEEEAWILFKDKAGDCVEDSTLLSMVEDVVKECKGLPIALVTVGGYLQNQKNKCIWADSLSQLRKSNPIGIPKVLRDVFKPLKLSFDGLDNDSERHLFLLCCLFPEDFNISVEQLTWYVMGLGFFDDISNIEEARNRMQTLIEKLESRFLLIDGLDKQFVKMHDVVRDVAIYIGSKEMNGFLKSLSSIKNSSDVNCNWMSVDISNERMEVPVLSRFPNLQLLMWSSKAFYDISHLSFIGMEDLKVLSFEDISIGSLPTTLESLTHLQTLRLVKCEVKSISVIGKLTSLKILSCYSCENIAELPLEIGRLKDLRLLELSECELLQTIPFGVLSSLDRLEELKMSASFSRWETEENGKERRNASLRELECLPNLSYLEIEIDDCTLSSQEICLSQNLVKYYIRIGDVDTHWYDFEVRDYEKVIYWHDLGLIDYEKVMILNLGSDIGAVGKWIQEGVRNSEGLYLIGDGWVSNNFNIAEIKNLRNLRVDKCSKLISLSSERVDEHHTTSLHFVCNPKDVSFCNLKSILISRCDNLRYLSSVSVATTCLLQLKVLQIKCCESMEHVFWNEIRDDNNTYDYIELPKLEDLRLYNLPKLNSIFPGDVSFSNLKSIDIKECHNLRYLLSVSLVTRCLLQLVNLRIEVCDSMEHVFWNKIRDDNDTYGCIDLTKLEKLTLFNLPKLNSIFSQDVSFSNLTYISIGRCHNLRYIFSVSVATKCLLQLEYLHIFFCDTMEHVFWNEINNTDGCIELPKLRDLMLRNLPKLNSIFLPEISLCNLKFIEICGCHNLRYLISVSVATTCLLQLEVLRIEDCDSMEHVFWNEIRDDNSYPCIELPKLEKLTLHNLCNLTAFCQGLENISKGLENIIVNFPNLKEWEIGGLPSLKYSVFPLSSKIPCSLKSLQISRFPNLKHLFSGSVVTKILLQLEVLSIKDCEAMEGVFWDDGREDSPDGCIEFSKLNDLTLENLPNFTAFCQELQSIIVIKFPNLKKMKIGGGLPKLNSMCPLNSERVVGDDQNTSLHFVCNPKVEMGSLKELSIFKFGDDIRNIWCHQIPNNIFNNLERLYIWSVRGIRSLMSISIAKNLMSLEWLSIYDCEVMTEVIETDDDDDDKQVVDHINSLFPNLRELWMGGLCELKKFWQWNHALELPLLEDVKIDNCPMMETFTLGCINTPNIRKIEVNSKKIEDQKNLNEVMRHIWIESQRHGNENKNEDKDKSEDECSNEKM